MDRIGILGGTFNPIHIGHLILAENAYEQYNLDKVWIMPSGMPPHKSHSDIATAEIRSAMVKLSIMGNRHLEFSGVELEREGFIYTFETLQLLNDKYPDTQFSFIIGEDSLDTFDKWRMPEKIVKLADILVAVRSDKNDIKDKVSRFNDTFKCDAKILNTPYIGISSRDIRKRVAEGRSIKYMVTADAEQYIYNNGLYKS